MTDLHLEIPAGLGLRAGIETAIRSSVHAGTLMAGTVMPSSRSLASRLGCSRATVVAAYEQLIAEGFLMAVQGSATIVADVHTPAPARPSSNLLGEAPRHDFRPGEPDASAFPRAGWARSLRTVMRSAPDEALGYPDPRGRIELRTALASYLARTRSVRTDADGVHVVGGFASALGFLAELFGEIGSGRIAVEDPMLHLHRDILRIAGADVVPVPVDAEGISVDRLAELHRNGEGVDAVLVTPAHQHPLGVTMSAQRRTALVAWARANEKWVIEDDYDGEFRYDRRPVGALQALAPDRVIHAGTASKTLAAGLRMAWLTIPGGLRGPYVGVTHIRAGVSTIEQLALADFVDTGRLDRHVAAMRRRYMERRAILSRRLTDEVPWLHVPDVAAGLHFAASIAADGPDEADVVASCAARSIGIVGLSELFANGRSAGNGGLLIGFSRPPGHQFEASVEHLAVALAEIG